MKKQITAAGSFFLRVMQIPSVFAQKSVCSLALLFGISIIAFLGSCKESVLKRPYGYLRIGSVEELKTQDPFLDRDRLYLGRDASGWYAMSTLCTFDLTPLVLKDGPQGKEFVSEYTESRYSLQGKVLHGPSVGVLPYYRLRLESGVIGSKKDTLFAEIGNEVGPEWRLKIPEN